MNLDRIFLLILFISSNFSFSQTISSGIVTYSIKPISLVDKKANQDFQSSSHFKDLNLRKNKLSKFIEYKLKFDNDESVFFMGEILENEYKRGTSIFFKVGTIYNHLLGEKIRQKNIYGSTFLIVSSSKDVKWKLSKETKKIGKYTCYKATTIKTIINVAGTFYRNVTAWYCPELAIPFGPMGYGNLPGLILELKINKKGIYTLKKLILNPNKKISIKKPIRGNKVTPKEFDKIGKDIYERRKNGM